MQIVKSIDDKVTDNLPIVNIIMFESNPSYADNAKAVFDEMLLCSCLRQGQA